ncbi:LysM peptidoglycan-binding domain-containing protein [Phototrophicus methaneseepsis]|uniref:LysM peptidoglycan-binding domain-containing protein n=1 Tax=Phototrophicus methaneseepsis TaxID=2710758 RepID=A0A7S8ECY9_9CHLR|nr:LysM peptidoglycan-binding domain-containing protein [Phototrophicus methaneseepsis]QPC84654.1 LysM peptidoglycan-binding domain-containing protein [Phototrophicus methaneseepsis]
MPKRVFGFIGMLAMILLAAGCYQQAAEDFETIDSQNVQPTNSSDVVIIDPNSSDAEGDTTPEEDIIISDMELTATAIFSEPTSTADMVDAIVPTTPAPDAPNATATIRIIEPAGGTTPTQLGGDGDGALVPTATRVTVVTPGVDTQIDFPTATDAVGGSTGSTGASDLDATPTGIAEVGDASCTYVIQSGDTLFRIAINDERFSLEELLAANDLAENAIIQPGQELVLPNCVSSSTTTTTDETVSQPTVVAPTGSTIHVVASGETLFVIAQNYGITMDDIIAANDLPNPDNLSIGQELIIPQG